MEKASYKLLWSLRSLLTLFYLHTSWDFTAAHLPRDFDCNAVGAPALGVSKYRDDTNCQHVVYCVNQKAFIVVCPPMTQLNPETLDCDLVENIKSVCDASKGNTVAGQKFSVLPNSPSGVIVNDCAMRVSGNYPLMYGDCTQYVRCTHGKASLRRCYWSLLFDIDTQECTMPSKARCWTPPLEDGEHLPGGVILASVFYDNGIYINNGTARTTSPGKRNKNAGLGRSQTSEVHAHEIAPFQPNKECHYVKTTPAKKIDILPDGVVITSMGYKNDGQWQEWQNCASGTYVNGFSSFRRAAGRSGSLDNVGIITISFQCQAPSDAGQSAGAKNIFSFAPEGAPATDLEFHKYYNCEEGGVAIGFQLNSEKDQGPKDDIATANVKLFCSCGKPLVKPYWTKEFREESRRQGEWLPERYCQPKQAICGVNTQMQEFIESDKIDLLKHDNTGLNNIKFKCCNIPNPAINCAPVEKQILVAVCDNSASNLTRPCEFDATIGTAYDYSKNENLIHFYEGVGYNRPSQVETLTERMTSLSCYNSNSSCLYDWKNANNLIWTKNERVIKKLFMPPRWKAEFHQVVGECSHYVIHTNKFMRTDSNAKANQFSKQYVDLF